MRIAPTRRGEVVLMQPDRREFLRHVGWATGAGVGLLATRPAFASGPGHAEVPADVMGVLVDLTLCVGCRLCEHACKKSNGFEPGPVESYDDPSVFHRRRRPAPDARIKLKKLYPSLEE